MLKRTTGLFLITVLVITGLAGRVHDATLTKQERKFAVAQFKDTKTALVDAVKGLSEAQLNYHAAPDRWSIKECVYHITLGEKQLWDMLETTMKTPATPEKRSEVKISDDDFLKAIESRKEKRQAAEPMLPGKASWNSTAEAISAFKDLRAAHTKYAKTTTEDLRNHIIPMPFGSIDGYQFMLLLAGHTNRHTQQILEVKADPGFPKN
jgi:hypothetical protein